MKRSLSLALSVAAVATLVACGGGGGGTVTVAAADTAVPTNAAIAGAVVNTPYSFPNGVTSLGTTAATSLSFTSTSSTPAFAIASGGNTATGATSFGSCIFVVSSSSFPAGHPLAQGATVTVNPCTLNVATSGAPADGVARPRNTTLQLGGTTSNGTPVAITVNGNGSVTINNTSAGTVGLTQVSG